MTPPPRLRPGALLALLLLTLPAAPPARAQICVGDVYLEFQTQVDAFNCVEVTGNLTIVAGTPNSTDITNLLGLSELTTVGGYFYSENADFLTSLEGLESLTSVGSWFGLYDNLVSSLDPLKSLTSVGDVFQVAGLSNLTDCGCGLSGLVSYTGSPSGVPAFTGAAGGASFFANGAGCSSEAEALAQALPITLATDALDGPGGSPVAQPVAVPAGDDGVDYTAMITNTSGAPLTTELWPGIRFPDGTLLVKRRTRPVTLGAGESLTINGQIDLFAAFPDGPYTFFGFAGTPGTCEYEVMAITMEKASARSGVPTLTAAEIAALDLDDFVTFESEALATTTADRSVTTTLGAAYPNPFNPSTTVPFSLTRDGSVRLAVYDLLGREVAVLAEGRMDAGSHTAPFDASHLASGTYLVRFSAPDGRVHTQRLTLLK